MAAPAPGDLAAARAALTAHLAGLGRAPGALERLLAEPDYQEGRPDNLRRKALYQELSRLAGVVRAFALR